MTRVVYGRWHEPYEVLAGLGERLEAAADIDRLLTAVVTELTTGLDLHDVSVSEPTAARRWRAPAGASSVGTGETGASETRMPAARARLASASRCWPTASTVGPARPTVSLAAPLSDAEQTAGP